MINTLKTGLLLLLTMLTLAACSTSPGSYGDPDAQRDRSKDAQDEMRRDTK